MKILIALLSICGFGALGLAVYFGIIRPHTKPNPTERYEAENQNYYTFEPHYGLFGGCASYRVMADKVKK